MKRVFLLGILAGGLFFADAAHRSAAAVSSVRYDAAARSTSIAAADTLRYAVAAGRTLIASLPETLATRLVRAYAVVRAPARSGLAGRSFFWRTRPQDTGRHRLLFEAAFDEAPPETLVVQVEVRQDGLR